MSLRWEAPFDPNEVKDYGLDFTSEMDFPGNLTTATDSISSVTYTIAASATEYLAVASATNVNAVTVGWFSAVSATALQANLAGQTVDVTIAVTTAGGRTLSRTAGLRIKNL